ncbi:MAG: Gfo/Idh/MocA family oxidoreductase [Fimbriimonas sp.]|nr:Gfo/Idh/MocA family oxidoreductase [Fimbriimonas sp.]
MAAVRAGVVGAGFIGPVHVEALRRIGVDVVGFVEVSESLAQARKSAMGDGKIYESLEALLADPTIDLVHITSPNHLHYAQCKAVLEAGKNVLCEKPLAMNIKESAELVELAKKTGLVAAVNFNVRYYPLAHEAQARIQKGELGELVAVHGSYLQDWLLYPTDWSWRLERQFSGSMRAIADIGSHWLDLITFITGLRIESVMADFKTLHKTRKKPTGPIATYATADPNATEDYPIDTEDYASVLIRFEGGARGVVTASQLCAGRKNQLTFEIDGSEEALAWNSTVPNELWIGHRNRPNEILIKDPGLLSPEARDITSYPGGHNEGFPDTFKHLYRDVDHAMKNPGAPTKYPTFADGHYELLIGEAIYLSATTDRWVRLDEIKVG